MAILVVAFTVFAFFHLACAQQANRIFRVGFLGQGKPLIYKNRINALHQGLFEYGYFEGQNMRFEYRYAEGKADRFTSLAAELVGLEVDVIITTGTPSTRAAKVEAGGLMSYGPDMIYLYRRMGICAGKILKGAAPADLPVELPKKFDLVINLKTAEKIGLAIPPKVLMRTTRVLRE